MKVFNGYNRLRHYFVETCTADENGFISNVKGTPGPYATHVSKGDTNP